MMKLQSQLIILTKRKLNSFSGGEKAMAMYIPLFSALYARFSNGASWSLMIISMDEAFSVVDDENKVVNDAISGKNAFTVISVRIPTILTLRGNIFPALKKN